jgi:hypothetical protein
MTQMVRAGDISLHDLEMQFNLQRTFAEDFFSEWQGDLPEVTDLEQPLLDRLKAGYFNLIKYPPLLEDIVKMAVLGPLLYFAGFYLYPFHTKSEHSIRVSSEDDEIIIEGKIDVLVLKDQFWVMVIESKRAAFSIEAGLAQILAYMLAHENNNQSCFGMITTGGSFVFIKLVKGETSQYALSRVFELNNPGNELYLVLAILKRLEQVVLNEW